MNSGQLCKVREIKGAVKRPYTSNTLLWVGGSAPVATVISTDGDAEPVTPSTWNVTVGLYQSGSSALTLTVRGNPSATDGNIILISH